jgi:hypothetical protein
MFRAYDVFRCHESLHALFCIALPTVAVQRRTSVNNIKTCELGIELVERNNGDIGRDSLPLKFKCPRLNSIITDFVG